MTDTPGWVSPSSSAPEPEDTRPPAATPAGPDGTSASSDPGQPADRAPERPTPPPYAGTPYGDPQIPHQQGGQPPQQGWSAPQRWGTQPGWGQQPGGQFPGWGAPPSPKPGVIPLRPLSVGEILDGSISTVRKHWRTVLGLSLVVAVLTNTTLAAVSWYTQGSGTGWTAVVAFGAAVVLDLLASLILTALLTMVISKAIVGESITLGPAWRAARPQLPKLLGVSLLVPLIVVGIVAASSIPLFVASLADSQSPLAALIGVPVLLGGLGVAIWTGVRLSLAAPALMLEKQGVLAAMARSRRLVRGSWWRILGVTLLGYVLTFLLTDMIAIPFSVLAAIVGGTPFALGSASATTTFAALVISTIGAILGSLLSYPVTAGISVLLYVDQRIRREGLDIELARAAGLPEYGSADRPAPPTGA
ncbi:hypothetical protein P3T37_004716 [Kitasatospora sp. MAA4]|uniref:DUF7544 domain-containing protein n=1 Tax=Kitasatospora sp. MAA4 TaxID=3035093 RepID=UPI002473A301|nr:hypothetical protein [Kitasatospora sp. MAA4]MDH6135306.1 hypothetical protein [Kitasatospora sp. MAA4]